VMFLNGYIILALRIRGTALIYLVYAAKHVKFRFALRNKSALTKETLELNCASVNVYIP
jgi:hypothetical protein